jgi:hypothetical protein
VLEVVEALEDSGAAVVVMLARTCPSGKSKNSVSFDAQQSVDRFPSQHHLPFEHLRTASFPGAVLSTSHLLAIPFKRKLMLMLAYCWYKWTTRSCLYSKFYPCMCNGRRISVLDRSRVHLIDTAN